MMKSEGCSLRTHSTLTNDKILVLTKSKGYSISKNGIRTYRRSTSLFRRHNNPQLIEQVRAKLREFFEGQNNTVVRSYGRNFLYTHVRQQYINVPRDIMFTLYKDYFPEETQRRKEHADRRRGGWTTPGPNFMWSLDAHLKLDHWGIELYAGIDAYSRYITWFYCGVSAKTSWNVYKQVYLRSSPMITSIHLLY
ncbi:MAG TPA: hypothetical protein VFQ43_02885 [Nitrososphaera sp.]|nr:hypothetical protein [Nitrososphaera sp.]